jgi:large subunit ribosomal protein L24
MASKIKKGDKVIVRTGRDSGKSGEVLKVLPKDDQVIVQGVNVVKRHQRPSMSSQGGIVEKEAPIDVSNVAIADPKDGKPARVGFTRLDDGRKVRISRRSGEAIDR